MLKHFMMKNVRKRYTATSVTINYTVLALEINLVVHT